MRHSEAWDRPRLAQNVTFESSKQRGGGGRPEFGAPNQAPTSSTAPSSVTSSAASTLLGSAGAAGRGLRKRSVRIAIGAAAVLSTLVLISPLSTDSDRPRYAAARPSVSKSGPYGGRPWSNDRTVGKVTLGETPFARCDVHSVKTEDGKGVINDWIFFEERDAVNVVIADESNRFLVFKQRKYAIPGETLSPVGGFIEDGESPYDAARREVMEELGVGSPHTLQAVKIQGVDAGGKPQLKFGAGAVPLTQDGTQDGRVTDGDPDWMYLGMYRTAANRGGGFLHTYLLKNAVPLAEKGGSSAFTGEGDDEEQNLLRLTQDEVMGALLAGEFKEVKWAAAFSLAMLRLQGNVPGPTLGQQNV